MDDSRDPYGTSQPSPAAPQTVRVGVGGGIAALLVILALFCGLVSGLLIGGAGGFAAGRASTEGGLVGDLLTASAPKDSTERDEPADRAPSAAPTSGYPSPAAPDAGGEPASPTVPPRQPFIGVLVQTAAAATAAAGGGDPGTPGSSATGALIMQVEPGSPAEIAGLAAGDVIVAFDGRAVETSDDLKAAILAASIGDTITLRVRRDGQERDVEVTLGGREARSASTEGLPDLRVMPFDPSDPDIGSLLEQLPPEIREQLEKALESGAWPPGAQPAPGQGDA